MDRDLLTPRVPDSGRGDEGKVRICPSTGRPVTAEATALPGSARPAAHRPEREAEKVSRVVEAWPAGFRRAAERRASAEVTDLQEAAADYDTGSKDAA